MYDSYTCLTMTHDPYTCLTMTLQGRVTQSCRMLQIIGSVKATNTLQLKGTFVRTMLVFMHGYLRARACVCVYVYV